MTKLDDVRKTIEATVGNLTPAKAQQIAKGFLENGAAKEQVAKTAAELLEWSQRTRERMRDFVRREVQEQLGQMGLATQREMDALKKRVRQLEREAGMTASGKAADGATRKTPARKAASSPKQPAKKPAPKKQAAKAVKKG